MSKKECCGALIDGATIEVYHQSPETGVKLYEVHMKPIQGASSYGLVRTFFINLMRKNSGMGALLNQDALNGYRGSAAMIDYLLRFEHHLNGRLDSKFMSGNTDSVRSRVKLIQDELYRLACGFLAEKGSFHLFEAGPGYLRTQLNLIERLRAAGHALEHVKMVGADINPAVVEAAKRVLQYEGVSDMVRICCDEAKHCLAELGTRFDVILAEGVFEYNDMESSQALASVFNQHLRPGGFLIGSATHQVPKKRLIEYLDIFVLQRSQEELVEIFRRSGFASPRLIPTVPPNISIGIGEKQA